MKKISLFLGLALVGSAFCSDTNQPNFNLFKSWATRFKVAAAYCTAGAGETGYFPTSKGFISTAAAIVLPPMIMANDIPINALKSYDDAEQHNDAVNESEFNGSSPDSRIRRLNPIKEATVTFASNTLELGATTVVPFGICGELTRQAIRFVRK